MLKLISILLTNGIVLFMLISCHNKTGNSKSTVNLEYENSIDSLNSYKMDISHFILCPIYGISLERFQRRQEDHG